MSTQKKIKISLPLVFSLILILGMYIGSKMSAASGNKTIIPAQQEKNKIQEFLNYVQLRYVDSVNLDHLEVDAIKGVLKELDPHSVYVPPKRLQRSNQSLKGRFEGIGIEFQIVNDTIMVVTPISGGPSDKLGIQAGDQIVKIEGDNVAGEGISNREVIKRLRGKKGTKVQVTIKRSGVQQPLKFNITRDKIPLHSLDASFMVNDSIGFIKINRFSATTYKEFKKGLNKLKEAGMTGLILDLRENPGGFMRAAVRIADEFLEDDKLVVYTEGRAQPRQDFHATSRGSYEQGKLTVLINRSSASASEILAGAVQDWGRGKIIGRRSFGKGLVQEQHSFSDSSAVRLTIARYYTPAGRSIQKPYKDGFKSHHRELLERYRQGELQHSDSIDLIDSLKYEAPSGKTVYGGGGIMPDIFVPLDTTSHNKKLIHVLRKGLDRKFAYSYISNHPSMLENYKTAKAFEQNYEVSDQIIQSFKGYIAEHDIQLKEIDKATHQFITYRIKAHMAKQKWGTAGQLRILHERDNIFQKAYQTLQSRAE